MASDSSNNTVLLELLRRHLENKPHENAEIAINEAKHEIVSSALDFLVKDASSSLVAARVILTVRDVSQPDGTRDQPTTELAVHLLTTAIDFSPSSSLVILDEIPKANGGSSPAPAPPHRASTIPTHPDTSSNPPKRPLAEIYKIPLGPASNITPDAPSSSATPASHTRKLHPVGHIVCSDG